MTSLLIVRRGRDIVGECDALCYNARGTACTCVCEAANHGVGLDTAIANIRAEHADGRAATDPAADPEDDVVLELGAPILQLALFPTP